MDSATDHLLLDALPDGVVLADETGTVTLVNAAGRRLLSAVDPVGQHLADVLSLQDRESNEWFACARPYDGLSTRTSLSEQSWFLADGTELLLTVAIERPSADQPVRRVAVSLRSARARARLDRERSDLVATVAHELRSPLTGVKGFVSMLLLKWDKLNDDQRKLILQTVSVDADRLARRIAELLDVARIDTGRLSIHDRPIDVTLAVRHVLASIRAGTGRDIGLEVAGDVPMIQADPDKLAQVLHNLVDNALRHGGGHVQLTITAWDVADGRGARIVVDDEGDGISPDIRKRVFTKFWKHGARGGSGLGMYIIHGLTQAHGGTVAIDDAPGGGARIILCWPAADELPPAPTE